MLTKRPAQRLGVFALMMLIVAAIDSVRNLPATALFGSSLLFFFIFSAIFFLIPVALVSAELSSHLTKKSGIFHWIYVGLGEKAAVLSIWLQWINTMVWFPTILSFFAATATYLIDPSLMHNKFYLISSILLTFWGLTLLNLNGLHFSAKFSSFCGIMGMLIPMGFIIAFAIVWLLKGHPSQIHFTRMDMFPSLRHMNNWVSLTAIMTAFLGIELATVHVTQVADPQKTFPKALFFSIFIILFTMMLGSLAIAIVVPRNEINLMNGVLEVFSRFFIHHRLPWFLPLVTGMLLLGTLGSTISWVISPAKGLLHAAQLGYLPPFFTKENKHGVPSRLLITQAIIVSMVCLAFLLMPSVNGSYWLLTALSTQLYILMYVLMFIAAIRLRYKLAKQNDAFTIPGGKSGMWLVCLFGLIGCGITLCVGFIPPTGINVGGWLHYEMVFCSASVGLILPVLLFYVFRSFVSTTTSFSSKSVPVIIS